MEISIIIPVCNEFPEIIGTAENVLDETHGLSSELILIDNSSSHIRSQFGQPLLSQEIKKKKYRKLRLMAYANKQSPWTAMNIAAQDAKGKILLFLDAHCRVSSGGIKDMLEYYTQAHSILDGPLHLPILQRPDWEDPRYCVVNTDRVKEGRLFLQMDRILPKKSDAASFVVPGMPVCGAMITTDMFLNTLKGFPEEMGIRRGGNEYFSFMLRLKGKRSHVYTRAHVIHRTVQRRYSFNWHDIFRNRAIAAYCTGGKSWLRKFMDSSLESMAKKNEPNVDKVEIIYERLVNDENLSSFVNKERKRTEISLTEMIEAFQEECPDLCTTLYRSAKKPSTSKEKPKAQTQTKKQSKGKGTKDGPKRNHPSGK